MRTPSASFSYATFVSSFSCRSTQGSCTTCSQSRCRTLIQSNRSTGFLHYDMLYMWFLYPKSHAHSAPTTMNSSQDYDMMYIVLRLLCICARWPFALDFGNEINIVHKNLVHRVLQSRMTVVRQEQSTLKVPWSSCTIVQVLVRNTVSRKCRQTSKHIIWVHGSSMVRDTKYCQT
jgi:hypothetical protein